MNQKFDVIVIGSGFGGAITACRLAQAGLAVCIVEKGRRWNHADFPRGAGEVEKSALSSGKKLSTHGGFIEYCAFRNMDVIQGVGLGGGSLHYFNVHKRPPDFIFEQGAWPEQIRMSRLRPYYELAAEMLGANTLDPQRGHRVPLRTQVFEDAVESLGLRAERVPICVRLADQPAASPGKVQVPFNVSQIRSACDHCGNCLLGCHLHAKNTLDLNYIALAEKHHAQVLTQHEALNITPDAQGYRVSCRNHAAAPADSAANCLVTLSAQRVVVAAGTLGTNQLLLHCKHRSRTLPRLSDQLGQRFSGNGDFLFAGTRYQDRIVEPGRGPSITAGVGFRKQDKQYIYIEDLGYPDPFIWYFNNAIPTRGRFKRLLRQATAYVSEALGTGLEFKIEELLEDGFLTRFLPYLGMGTDAADGRLWLNKKGELRLSWSMRNSLGLFRDMIGHMKDISEASGGRFINSFLWQSPLLGMPLKRTLTAHPLGGCAMSDTPQNGVTNDRGEVWGYPGLYVADGALMPAAIGVNPSATISAIAERVAFHMLHGRELQQAADAQRPLNTTTPLTTSQTLAVSH